MVVLRQPAPPPSQPCVCSRDTAERQRPLQILVGVVKTKRTLENNGSRKFPTLKKLAKADFLETSAELATGAKRT